MTTVQIEIARFGERRMLDAVRTSGRLGRIVAGGMTMILHPVRPTVQSSREEAVAGRWRRQSRHWFEDGWAWEAIMKVLRTA